MILDRHKSVPLRIKQLMGEHRLDFDMLSRRLTADLGVPFPLRALEDLIYNSRITLGFDMLLRIERILANEYPEAEQQLNGQQINGHTITRRPRRRLHPPEEYDTKGKRKLSRLPKSLSGGE